MVIVRLDQVAQWEARTPSEVSHGVLMDLIPLRNTTPVPGEKMTLLHAI